MNSQNQVSETIPGVGKKAKFKRALFRPEVQFFAYMAVFVVLGLVTTFWQPPAWILSVIVIGPFVLWMVGFLLLAALTPMPYPLDLPILIVRLRQLVKGIWAALMLVLSALLGATISADLFTYGTHNFQGFMKDVFIPGYFSLVVSLALWGGGLIYIMLTTVDLLWAGELARTEARHRGLHHLVERLGGDNHSEWPYRIQLLESVWKNLTGGPAQLIIIGCLTIPLVGALIYSAI